MGPGSKNAGVRSASSTLGQLGKAARSLTPCRAHSPSISPPMAASACSRLRFHGTRLSVCLIVQGMVYSQALPTDMVQKTKENHEKL
jgi:hypothetical protein